MYIRLIIEYAAIVWSTHTQNNIHAVKVVQQKAARFVFNDFARVSSITSMLELTSGMEFIREAMGSVNFDNVFIRIIF